MFTAWYDLGYMSGKTHQCPELCSVIIIIIHRHNQVANTVTQELAMKCGLSKEPPMSYYKYDPQSELQNATYSMYYDRSIITDRTVHNNKPDIIILHTTTTAAYSTEVAIPQSQPSQHLRRKAPQACRLERRACNNTAAEYRLHNSTSTVHKVTAAIKYTKVAQCLLSAPLCIAMHNAVILKYGAVKWKP